FKITITTELGFIGGAIVEGVIDEIFAEIRKYDADLRNMPKFQIEESINSFLKAKGYTDLVIGVAKISLEEDIIEIILKKSTKKVGEAVKEITKRVVREQLCLIS